MALLLHLLLLLLASLCIFTSVESADPYGLFCNENSPNLSSQTSANILKLLTNLVTVAAASRGGGYAAASYGGESKNKVYGLAQCRGDVSTQDCSSCIQQAAEEVRKRCPDRVDARIWYDYCFLRYNSEEFFGQLDTSYGILYANVANVTDSETFNDKLGNLVHKISKDAILPENKGLGKGKTKLSNFVTLYALVQCTRDLSPANCAECLAIAVGNNFPGFCNDKKGCRVLYSSCYVRYELYPFYFPLDSLENSVVAVSGDFESMNYHSSIVVYKP